MKTKIFTLIAALLLCSSLKAQYDVADAIAAANAGTIHVGDSIAIRGVITKLEFKAQYGSARIGVKDMTGADGEFEFYYCYSLHADTFEISTSAYITDIKGYSIHVGDTVIAHGYYSRYNAFHQLIGGHLTAIYSTAVKTLHIDNVGTVIIRNINSFEEALVLANADYGYHFVQWYDGYAENPHMIVIPPDSIFPAEFAKNPTVTYIYDNTHGIVSGDTTLAYDSIGEITFNAIPYNGYHFVRWSDGVKDNPRTILLTKDTTFTAEFRLNPIITYVADKSQGYVYGPTTLAYDSIGEITFNAIPYNGYHFVRWSDGNTDNPRTIVLTQDTTFAAEFGINNYTIETQSANPERGIVQGEGTFEYLSQQTVAAIPNYGYHFVKWVIDDTPENAISVAQAYAIASGLGADEYTTKQYTIVGYVTGKYGSYSNSYYLSDSPDVPGNFIAFKCASSVNIGEYVNVTGYITNYRGNTPETTSGSTIVPNISSSLVNPYTFTLKKNISFVAEFAKNMYTITKNAEHGSISGDTSAEYLDEVKLTANPDYGYHFTQWSDGNKENPRIFQMIQDTTFTAEFAIDVTGSCGDDLALTWIYDASTNLLSISGEGALTSNYTFGVQAPTDMQNLVVEEGVTAIGDAAFKGKQLKSIKLPNTLLSIGECAFYDNDVLKNLIIPNSVTTIGASAFEGSNRLVKIQLGENIETIGNEAFKDCPYILEIHARMEYPPVIDASVFTGCGDLSGIDCYVPEESMPFYRKTTVWKEFNLLEAEEPTATPEVYTNPANSAQKLISNGQVLIVRGDKTYTVTGQEVR